MSQREPIAVYRAANSLEAHFLCSLLTNCGIEATVVEAISHEAEAAPTIWMDRADVERAQPIFMDFERRVSERHDAVHTTNPFAAEETVLVTCEECGQQSAFPAIRLGLVQNCPQCNAYVDVGDVGFDDWGIDDGDVQPDES